MSTAEEFAAKQRRFETLCRNVFSGGEGAELLAHLQKVYVQGKLYFDTDRETVYAIGQRDLVEQLSEYIVQPVEDVS